MSLVKRLFNALTCNYYVDEVNNYYDENDENLSGKKVFQLWKSAEKKAKNDIDSLPDYIKDDLRD